MTRTQVAAKYGNDWELANQICDDKKDDPHGEGKTWKRNPDAPRSEVAWLSYLVLTFDSPICLFLVGDGKMTQLLMIAIHHMWILGWAGVELVEAATLYLCWDKEGVEKTEDSALDTIFKAVDASKETGSDSESKQLQPPQETKERQVQENPRKEIKEKQEERDFVLRIWLREFRSIKQRGIIIFFQREG